MAFPLLDPDTRHKLTHAGWPGVEFILRPIPRGRWVFLRNSMLLALEKAKRRAVRDLAAEGLSADLTAAKVREALDPEQAVEVAGLNVEIVRASLIEISGLELAGAPFSVGLEDTTLEGLPWQVIDRATIRVLAFQPALIPWLANEVWSLNELGPDEKKS